MNATAFEGGKVHWLTDEAARCGVGKQPRRAQWQTDLGEVTCRRCVRFRLVDQRCLAAGALPTDQRGLTSTATSEGEAKP